MPREILLVAALAHVDDDRAFLDRVPGTAGQPHTTITGAGHFLQEDKGPELATVIADFIDEKLTDPTISRDDVEQLIVGRGAHLIDLDGWKHIDAAEKAAGREAGRPRIKLTDVSSLEAAAGSAE